jgi:quaternary ammonium compound-resistance protein SugE
MPWVYLVTAGFCEVGFTTCLKLSNGLSKLWPSIGFLVLLTVSMALLTLATREIPMGTAYAVWTGIGAAGTAIIGILWFRDPATVGRLRFLALLIGSIIGLKFVSSAPKA